MARIAIVGPGAVGGIMAAWLGRGGTHEILLCARRPIPELTVETPDDVMVMRPNVITSPDAARAVDWVLVATKAYDVAGTAAWLGPLVAGGAPVAVLQNGVEHRERFAPYLPPERILPVVVQVSAERPEPARLRQRGAGRLVVAEGAMGRAFADLFGGTAITVALTADFTTAAWQKLCLNAAGALNALLLQPNRMYRHESVTNVARILMSECIAVGRAEGAVLDDDLIERCLTGYRNGPSDGINSIHADRLAGRPMEIDARNGAIVRFGRKHGIATPCNQMAVALLEALAAAR